MQTKLYSLLACLFVLTACTSEDVWQTNTGLNEEEMAISFSVDVPPASVMTRAATAPTDEKGIENLILFTFDAQGDFLKKVEPMASSGTEYKAVVGKETRSIVFLSNYNDVKTLAPSNKDFFKSFSTDEYLFWAECSISDSPNTDLGVVELLRNWAKIQVVNKLEDSKLTDIGYSVYHVSNRATMAPATQGLVNVPADNMLGVPAEADFKKIGEAYPTYLFENSNQNSKKSTFVIIRGKYSGASSYSYYKVDLSSTDNQTGASYVYDVIRNYQFNINLKAIDRKGVSWAEVIDENKIPDYNIITSVELVKYPSITFGDESLTVTNTTFLFTNPNGAKLDLKAVYKSAGFERPDNIKVLKSTDPNFDKIVSGSISNDKGMISATIRGAGEEEISTSFYVRGGDVLQRKITLILRPAYNFIDFRAVSEDETDGKVSVKFSIPTDLDPARNPLMESIYPLEFRIHTKKLYAVEDGVRIVTTGSGDYYYAYLIQGYQDAYSVAFEVNENKFTEEVKIAADLFNEAKATYQKVHSDITVTGEAKYSSFNLSTPIDKDSFDCFIGTNNDPRKIQTTSNRGSFLFVLEAALEDAEEVKFQYKNNRRTYTYTTTVGAIRESGGSLGVITLK